ncbi:putative Holliday junction resolvase [Stackebrandtia albiflava]|uniref:Putative pre-16S rRNA nuclease n=1 Tax=Stackebrandtia albiflava TaxID=406432 RepID=A0A562VDQ2_9ACTN|nr:Holliday junction resolvase RuvX [Stackebrandtia albiflava]TWJ16016.1 putative Holliday junction resolvase [Stackebrandtia albiflava]
MTGTPPVRGRRLGVDVGKVRVGVAWSDPDGILAAPLETVPRDTRAPEGEVPRDIRRIAELADEHDVVEIVVGLPVTLSGAESFAAAEVRDYAETLRDNVNPIPVSLLDERLTTVVASRRLAERGVKGRRRRAVVDQAAAVEILQQWLERQRKA